MYVLDTDHLSLLARASDMAAGRLRLRMAQLQSEERITTIITFEEQMRGWMSHLSRAHSLQEQVGAYKRLKDFLNLIAQFTVLDFDGAAAAQFERLLHLRPRVGSMDLKIAAIALTRDATVLSRNLRDFTKVPGLRVEDWTR